MAQHRVLWTLAQDTIEEYLDTVDHCIFHHRKADGGCLGCPAALLLLCIIDALGTYLRNEKVSIEGKNQTITKGEPFRVLNHPIFGQNLSAVQIKTIEKSYRNLLAHNALIASGHGLRVGVEGPPFEFRRGQVWISIDVLYRIVKAAWASFDKGKIKEAVRRGIVKA